jgi:hypothetical protein
VVVRRRNLIIIVVVLAAVAVGCVVAAVALLLGPPDVARTETVASAELSPYLSDDGGTVVRRYLEAERVHYDDGSSHVRPVIRCDVFPLEASTDGVVHVVEVIPKDFAESVDELEFSLEPDEVIEDDPVVGWNIAFDFDASEDPAEDWTEALEALQGRARAEWVRERAEAGEMEARWNIFVTRKVESVLGPLQRLGLVYEPPSTVYDEMTDEQIETFLATEADEHDQAFRRWAQENEALMKRFSLLGGLRANLAGSEPGDDGGASGNGETGDGGPTGDGEPGDDGGAPTGLDDSPGYGSGSHFAGGPDEVIVLDAVSWAETPHTYRFELPDAYSRVYVSFHPAGDDAGTYLYGAWQAELDVNGTRAMEWREFDGTDSLYWDIETDSVAYGAQGAGRWLDVTPLVEPGANEATFEHNNEGDGAGLKVGIDH